MQIRLENLLKQFDATTAVDRVNIKAKTAEKIGPVGLGQSMEARAVALIY